MGNLNAPLPPYFAVSCFANFHSADDDNHEAFIKVSVRQSVMLKQDRAVKSVTGGDGRSAPRSAFSLPVTQRRALKAGASDGELMIRAII